MKEVKVRFEQDAALDCIDVTVRSSERDAQAEAVMMRAAGHETVMLSVTDAQGARQVIPASDVLLISVSGKRVDVVTETGRYSTRQSLQSMEEALANEQFLRVSRFELANLAKIARYDFTLGGTLRLEFAGGIEAWASRRCIPAIRAHLNGKE
ncbi:MAG: LytTR family transcriptional regulator [Ruminococcaceae bacterium]|nr:LytTR family transcriptional regulator [Oscillospiraceae bacterium]